MAGDDAVLTSVLFKHRHKLGRIARLSNDSLGPEWSRVSQPDLEKSLESEFEGPLTKDLDRARQRQVRQSDKLFSQGLPVIDKVTQGGLSDCWFIASVASLAASRPEELKSRVQELPDGQFQVGFPDGSHQTVKAPTPTELITFANSGANGQWLSVLEKAQAEKNEGPFRDPIPQFVLEGGTVSQGIKTLTGNSSRTTYLRLSSLDKVEQDLQTHLAQGDIVVAASHPGLLDRLMLRNPDRKGIISNHAYSVVGYNSDTRALRLRNPWGEEDATVTVPLHEMRSLFTSITYEKRQL